MQIDKSPVKRDSTASGGGPTVLILDWIECGQSSGYDQGDRTVNGLESESCLDWMSSIRGPSRCPES